MNLVAEVLAADERVRGFVRETAVERSAFLSALTGAEVYLKLECLQVTGAFKVRGAFNRLLVMGRDERRRGYVAASSGNHGLALAHAGEVLGVPGTLVVPEVAIADKVDAVRQRGVEVVVHGSDCVESEARARTMAAERGRVYVSPYNDLAVAAGQGTVGVELARQMEEIDLVYLCVGGGGLASGVAAVLKDRHPAARVVGCSPERSAVMLESVRTGRIVEMESLPTLSDGSAGGVEPGAVTFELCRALVDRWVAVTEPAISAAMRLVIERHHVLVEGAAGVAVAGFLEELERRREELEGRRVVIVLCGANVSLETLRQVLAV